MHCTSHLHLVLYRGMCEVLSDRLPASLERSNSIYLTSFFDQFVHSLHVFVDESNSTLNDLNKKLYLSKSLLSNACPLGDFGIQDLAGLSHSGFHSICQRINTQNVRARTPLIVP